MSGPSARENGHRAVVPARARAAYAVIVDNEEGSDVDIVDISDPKKPVFLTEYDLDELFPQILTCKG